MLKIKFTLKKTLPFPQATLWDSLIDLKSHEAWIPLTKITLVPLNPKTFTATTGFGKISFDDNMTILLSDDKNYQFLLEKTGPLLYGSAGFNLKKINHSTTLLTWYEDIYIPSLCALSFLSPILNLLGRLAFTHSLRKLSKYLSA